MHSVLWVLQILTALMYGASGVMKIFMFDQISQEVPSFAVLPQSVWTAMGILELICVIGLILPGALHWRPKLTALAAAVLALESLIFIWVHISAGEMGSLIMSAVLGLIMAFIAYGRWVLKPLV